MERGDFAATMTRGFWRYSKKPSFVEKGYIRCSFPEFSTLNPDLWKRKMGFRNIGIGALTAFFARGTSCFLHKGLRNWKVKAAGLHRGTQPWKRLVGGAKNSGTFVGNDPRGNDTSESP